MHEWSLLIFTICMQTAIGMVVLITLFQHKINTYSENKKVNLLKLPLIIITVLSIMGLAASFTHLGTPTNAINTIINFGNSWMSNEIVITGIFIALIVIALTLVFLQKKVNMNIILIASVVGLIDIFCMAKIYTTSLVDGWNNLNTYTSFYGTAFVLGAIFFATFVLPQTKNENKDLFQYLLKWTFIISIIGVGIQLIGLAIFSMQEVNPLIIDATPWTQLIAPYMSTVFIRWIIEFIGVAMLGYLVLSSKGIKNTSIIYVVLLLLVGAEIMSRYVFYVIGA